MSTPDFYDNLNQWSQAEGFEAWGATSLNQPLSLSFYKSWLQAGYHGEMSYLEQHFPLKENPRLLDARLESALVFTICYLPHPKPQKSGPLRRALYAQGEDYHFWLKEKLNSIARRLESQFSDEVFLCATDSSPILERDLAQRAGLGWVGKNTCLLDRRRGSLFLIGEILTSLKLREQASQVADFCGTCTRCLDICPTQALEKPRILNATKCISYWTIESRQVPPLELRSSFGDHFFGCDLCQTVCPWNQKVFGKDLNVQVRNELSEESASFLEKELREILTLSGKKLQKKFQGTPLHRAGPFGLRRNALIVAANQKLRNLEVEISGFLKDEKLSELAHWALQQIRL